MVVTSDTCCPSWRRERDSACSTALSADGQRKLTQIREIFNLSINYDSDNATMEMEFVVVASSEVRPPGACLIGDISPVDIGPGWPREGAQIDGY